MTTEGSTSDMLTGVSRKRNANETISKELLCESKNVSLAIFGHHKFCWRYWATLELLAKIGQKRLVSSAIFNSFELC